MNENREPVAGQTWERDSDGARLLVTGVGQGRVYGRRDGKRVDLATSVVLDDYTLIADVKT